MPADLPLCPSCKSKQIVKNGKIDNGKHPRHLLQVGETAQRSVSQNYKCRECDRILCRKSTKIENHIRAIWYFVHHRRRILTSLGVPNQVLGK